MTERGSWGSRLGFILAVSGSAVGLGNIWRFPYIVGQNGGAAFIAIYLVCLALIGFPVFIAEIVIGRTTQRSPGQAFQILGGTKRWEWIGIMTIITGFLVSTFYSAVAGWILGYLVESAAGSFSFGSAGEAGDLFNRLVANPLWGVGYHGLFLLMSAMVLYLGVLKGIERWNKILMPLLFGLLILITIRGLTLPNSGEALAFVFSPDWSQLTAAAWILALGQAFFTLSLGQGTMVTYGSYLGRGENILKSCLPVALVDTAVSLLAATAIFSAAFAVGVRPDAGPGLLFHTLPWVFSQLPGGYLLALFFFMVVAIAALTSQISAMEPAIAHMIDEWGWTRNRAVVAVSIAIFVVGIPSALSMSWLAGYTFFGHNFLGFMDRLCSAFLIPLGGLAAVLLLGWVFGANRAISSLKVGAESLFFRHRWIATYFWFCFKYCAPLLIVLVFLSALGIFG